MTKNKIMDEIYEGALKLELKGKDIIEFEELLNKDIKFPLTSVVGYNKLMTKSSNLHQKGLNVNKQYQDSNVLSFSF